VGRMVRVRSARLCLAWEKPPPKGNIFNAIVRLFPELEDIAEHLWEGPLD
jgi:hypothetical protein